MGTIKDKKKPVGKKPAAKKPEGISYWNKANAAADEVGTGHDDSVKTTPHTRKATAPEPQRLCLAITGRLNRKDSEQRQVYVPNTFLARLMAVTSGPIQNVLLVLAERELSRLEKSKELVRVDMGEWDGSKE